MYVAVISISMLLPFCDWLTIKSKSPGVTIFPPLLNIESYIVPEVPPPVRW